MNCPYCKKEQNANYSIEDKKYDKPSENDLSVCAYCGEISVFGKKGKSLRRIDDMDKLIIDKKLLKTCLDASRIIKYKKIMSN